MPSDRYVGYIGSAQDAKRIRQLTEKRELERKRMEEKLKESEDAVLSSGLRKFGTGATEVVIISALEFGVAGRMPLELQGSSSCRTSDMAERTWFCP